MNAKASCAAASLASVVGLALPSQAHAQAVCVTIPGVSGPGMLTCGGGAAADVGGTALGPGSTANGYKSTSVGLASVASGLSGLSLGNSAQSTGTGAIAIGGDTMGTGLRANNGNGAFADADVGTVVGNASSIYVGSTAGTALGYNNTIAINSPNATAVGSSNIVVGNSSGAFGTGLTVVGNSSYMLGDPGFLNGNASIVSGTNDYVNGSTTSVLGSGNVINASNTGTNGDGIGVTGSNNEVAGGASATGAIIVGNNNLVATANGAIAAADSSNAAVLGNGNTVNAVNAVAIGNGTTVSAPGGVAIGQASSATIANSVALGANAITTAPSSTAANAALGVTNNAGTVTGVVSVGAAGAERQIQNVAAGAVTPASTDAVKGSQLYSVATNGNTLGTTTAAAIGGGATYAPTTGITGPSYGLNGSAATYTNVVAGEQALASGAAGPVQYATPGTVSNAINLVGAGGPVTLGNVAPGAVTRTSLQAVNGGQLYGTAASVATALGGGAGVSPGGAVTAPRYAVGNTTYNNVGDAITALQSGASAGLSNLQTRVDKNFQRANGGIAAASAAAGVRYDSRPGKLSAGVAVAGWNGEAGLSGGLGYTTLDARWRVNAAFTLAPSSGGHTDVGAVGGVSYTFN